MEQIVKSTEVKGAILNRIGSSTLDGWVADLAVGPLPSMSASERYADIATPPVMREWYSGRKPTELREETFEIENIEYEASMILPKKYLRRDKLGLIEQRIDGLVARRNQHWKKLITQRIVDGETRACYDDQFFFDTDHPIRETGGTQSNDISVDISELAFADHGSVTAPSVSEMAAAINQGIKQILSMLDDRGEPINDDLERFIVMSPIGLSDAANAAVRNQVIERGQLSTVRSMGFQVDIATNPRLTSLGSWTDKFAVFGASADNRPIILQEEVEAEMVTAKAEGSDFEHDHNAHEYGVSASRGCDYGAYHTACLVTLT